LGVEQIHEYTPADVEDPTGLEVDPDGQAVQAFEELI
jgi:hypothetical protein